MVKENILKFIVNSVDIARNLGAIIVRLFNGGNFD